MESFRTRTILSVNVLSVLLLPRLATHLTQGSARAASCTVSCCLRDPRRNLFVVPFHKMREIRQGSKLQQLFKARSAIYKGPRNIRRKKSIQTHHSKFSSYGPTSSTRASVHYVTAQGMICKKPIDAPNTKASHTCQIFLR